jgi:hypothetical protein
MIDEAFMPFRQVIERLLSFRNEVVDETAGVRSHIYEYDIDLPLELDVVRDDHLGVQIGSTPPLYYVDTSFRPSFHRLRFTAEVSGPRDGD